MVTVPLECLPSITFTKSLAGFGVMFTSEFSFTSVVPKVGLVFTKYPPKPTDWKLTSQY